MRSLRSISLITIVLSLVLTTSCEPIEVILDEVLHTACVCLASNGYYALDVIQLLIRLITIALRHIAQCPLVPAHSPLDTLYLKSEWQHDPATK